MSQPEISISLTPQQAAVGAVVTVPLPSGAIRVRVPPARDGDLVRLWVGQQEVLLRIRVTAGAAGGTGAGKWVAVLAVAALVVFVAVVAGGGDDDSADDASPYSSYSGYSSPSYSYSGTYEPYTDDPYTYTDDPYTDDPYDYGTDDPYAEETEAEAPDPYTSGTCLNGTLPDSTTAQEVDGVEEVDCSASDAHYKVIQTIPFSSDMSQCNANPRTEYAFSYRYTMNGTAINEYVYCLVGLGSYAR